ncbi:MAG: hypothetical protein E5X67_05740 [Mesorhizobium sp.]|uniref:hypothetical protein n=1 Tax=Mesorhizobium sp. TaxID=1871066 RepID=UPI00122B4502|nr:hypothetical protein [Mesorhizobium sp.]TIP29750.1 MAG: hypothetical protein E5X67_05740 [Mesorhizobium sp.]
MKMLGTILAAWVAIVGGISATAADPWKDESGHGKWQGRYRYYEDDYEPKRERYSYKEEYRRGNCKIERKWEGDEYKEEIKCKRGKRRVYDYY